MSKPSKIAKKSVELQSSRIRREPVKEDKDFFWVSREWENRVAVVGIILFAVALTLLTIGVAEVTQNW